MARELDPEEIRRLVAGGDLAGPPYLAIPQIGTPYHVGSMAPIVGAATVTGVPAGISLPGGARGESPLDYVGVYLVLRDYVRPEEIGVLSDGMCDAVMRAAVTVVGTENLIRFLCALGMTLRSPSPDHLQQFRARFIQYLQSAPRARVENALRPGPEQRVFLARQSLLASLRVALALPEIAPAPGPDPNIELWGLLFVHAVADGLAAEPSDDGQMIGRMPARLAAEMVRNAAFYETDDLYAAIDRQVRLWREFGAAGRAELGGVHPTDLVVDITGIEVEDFLALGFALMSHTMAWDPGKPLYLDEGFGAVDAERREAFLSLVASTREDLRMALAAPARSTWDFLAFQEAPVLRAPQGLLVLDPGYLFGRVTTGLYWIIHDYMRDERGPQHLDHWRHAWADMVEAIAVDELRPHAPKLFGPPSGASAAPTFYRESEIQKAYPGSKAADVVIDFGTALGAFEIVSGQLTIGTRIDGSPEAFRKDMEKLVFKKMRQLDKTAANLIGDECRLTGWRGEPREVFPVVVIGSGFVLNPIVANCIEDQRGAEGLFELPRIRPLSVIDLAELEMLEGLAVRGRNVLEVLDKWHQSGIAAMPLHNWLFRHVGTDPQLYRPPRMQPHMDATFVDLLRRLGVPDDTGHAA